MTEEPEPSPPAEPEPTPAPSPDDSPFSTPPLEPAERGNDPPETRDDAGRARVHDQQIELGESPWETPPIEGIPFERGSEEDLAIRQVIEEAEAERRQRAGP
jgi:hypothetical protein